MFQILNNYKTNEKKKKNNFYNEFNFVEFNH